VSPLLSPALTAKINEIEQALKARIMELEEELTAGRNAARPKNDLMPVLDHLAEIKRVVEECALEGQSLRLVEMFDSRAPRLARRAMSSHSFPILFSHSLNAGRSISISNGQPRIECGDSHGSFTVSGTVSRMLLLLINTAGYRISGSGSFFSSVVSCFGSGAGMTSAACS
jgi:hypothetical protein